MDYDEYGNEPILNRGTQILLLCLVLFFLFGGASIIKGVV